MLDEHRDVSLLAAIKTHFDHHGIASAIINDHVAIGLLEGARDAGAQRQRIVRVKSLDEARCVIGRHCPKGGH